MLIIKLLHFVLIIFASTLGAADIYSYKVNNLSHTGIINFKEFKGKKILIVNTALASQYSDQLSALDSLAQKYKNNLVVVAFPSNSFGNESEDERNINRIINQRYKVHFYLAEKISVKGDDMHPVYQWLTQKNLNGIIDNEIKTDFEKFLIDEEGSISGVFSPSTSPMSSAIEEMITTNFKN